MMSRMRCTSGPDGVLDRDPERGWTAADAAPHRLRPGPVVAALATLGLVLCLAVGLGFFVFVASIDRYERSPSDRADAIVALTGGAERIGDAIDLLAKGYGGRLLITGVNERTSREEIARLNPGQRRLFDCCVDLDYRARNTIGNAIETRRWMRDNRFRSLIVVTSNYHMPRTLLELDNVLPAARKVPFAVVHGAAHPESWWRHPGTARLLASEYLKFVIGWVRTRLEVDPEGSAAAVLASGGAPVKVVARPLAR